MSDVSSFVVSCRHRNDDAQVVDMKEDIYKYIDVVIPLGAPQLSLAARVWRDDATTRRHNKTNGLRAGVSSPFDDACCTFRIYAYGMGADVAAYSDLKAQIVTRQDESRPGSHCEPLSQPPSRRADIARIERLAEQPSRLAERQPPLPGRNWRQTPNSGSRRVAAVNFR